MSTHLLLGYLAVPLNVLRDINFDIYYLNLNLFT